MAQAARQHFDFSEYLSLEAVSPVRHEFLDGMVWAMAGGSPDHARIAANLAGESSGELSSVGSTFSLNAVYHNPLGES